MHLKNTFFCVCLCATCSLSVRHSDFCLHCSALLCSGNSPWVEKTPENTKWYNIEWEAVGQLRNLFYSLLLFLLNWVNGHDCCYRCKLPTPAQVGFFLFIGAAIRMFGKRAHNSQFWRLKNSLNVFSPFWNADYAWCRQYSPQYL